MRILHLTVTMFVATSLMMLVACEKSGQQNSVASNGAADSHAGHNHGAEPHKEPAPTANADSHAGHNHGKAPHQEPAGTAADLCAAHGVDKSLCFICEASVREKGRLWCTAHARYEDRCWLCHAELEDKKREYCKEHSLYEDECFYCHPELIKKITKPISNIPLNTPDPTAKAQFKDLYCKEHRLYEFECGICQPQLATQLQPGQVMKVRFSSKQSVSKAGITTGKPLVSNAAPSISTFCQVQYNQNALARITPRATGIVRHVLVDVGALVKKGDILAELESSVLAQAKSTYLAKRQALELAKIDMDRSRTIFDNTAKALKLLKGKPPLSELQKLSELELGLNRKELLTTYVEYITTEAAYLRQKKLIDSEITSEADFQAAESAWQKAWAGYLATMDDIAFGSKRDLEAKTRAHQSTQFELASARRHLFTLGLNDKQIEQIPTQKDQDLSKQHVSAPYTGTIVERKAVNGETVEPGHMLFSLADLTSMWVVLSVPVDQIGLVRTGVEVQATFTSMPGVLIKGKLTWVDTSVDQRSRMVKARALVPNPDGKLKSGMFGQARVTIGNATKSLRVPKTAIQRYERQPYVFVKLEEDLYAMKRVLLSDARDQTTIEVIGGLRGDEPIVTTGAFVVMSEFLKSRLGAGCAHH